MSDRAVLQQTPERRTDIHSDEVDDTITLNTVQDVEPVLEENKRRMNEFGDKLTPGKRGEWHHVAEIPVTVWEQWCKETNNEIQRDTKLLRRYLNSPEFKYFKVAPTNL